MEEFDDDDDFFRMEKCFRCGNTFRDVTRCSASPPEYDLLCDIVDNSHIGDERRHVAKAKFCAWASFVCRHGKKRSVPCTDCKQPGCSFTFTRDAVCEPSPISSEPHRDDANSTPCAPFVSKYGDTFELCVHGKITNVCWLCCPNTLTHPELRDVPSKLDSPYSSSSEDDNSVDSDSCSSSDSDDSDYVVCAPTSRKKKPQAPSSVKPRSCIQKAPKRSLPKVPHARHARNRDTVMPSQFVTLHTDNDLYFMFGSNTRPELLVAKEMLGQIVDNDVKCIGWCEWIEGVDDGIKGERFPSLRQACIGLRAHVGRPISSGSVNAYTQLKYKNYGTLAEMRIEGTYKSMFG